MKKRLALALLAAACTGDSFAATPRYNGNDHHSPNVDQNHLDSAAPLIQQQLIVGNPDKLVGEFSSW